MKVSELVAELSGHQPDGHVVIREIDAVPDRILMVESILKETGSLPLLMARRTQSVAEKNSLLSEALFQKAFEAHMRGERWQRSYKTTVEKSPLDGKYWLTLDGTPVIQEGFETDAEARSFLRGFILGRESGAAEAK